MVADKTRLLERFEEKESELSDAAKQHQAIDNKQVARQLVGSSESLSHRLPAAVVLCRPLAFGRQTFQPGNLERVLDGNS